MLAKKTSKNQVTLPKAIVQEVPETDYFDVSVKDGAIVLKPVTVHASGERLSAVREKIAALGLTETDVADAVRWARRRAR
jgi:hypothetical protein